MFVLYTAKGHYLQLRCHPPLICNFKQFDIKTAAAHHPVIKRKVDEILAKGVIETSIGGADYLWFLSIQVVYVVKHWFFQ